VARRQKRGFLITFLFFILLPVAFSLEVTPISWSESCYVGSTLTKTFSIFNQDLNNSITINLDSSGDISSWIFITPSSLSISPNSSESFSVAIVVPSNTSSGTFYGKININNDTEIPLTFFVQNLQEKKCSLIPYPSSYTRSIQQNSIKNKNINILVSTYCKDQVVFQGIDLSGDIITFEDGLDRPFRLEEENLGPVLPGSSFTIPLVIDSNGLETGSYQAVLTINALDSENNPLQISVPLTVHVTTGASPLEKISLSDLPQCSLPSTTLKPNETYTFMCNNVNPNIKIKFSDSILEYFKGIKVEEPSGQFLWTFTPTKSGETSLDYYFTYKDVPISGINGFAVKIVGDHGTELKFNLIPNPESLAGEGEITVQVRDAKTNNIVDATILLDGLEVQGNKIKVSPGNHTLTAYAPGYNTIDYSFTINKKEMDIIFDPPVFEVGQKVGVSIVDKISGQKIEDFEIFVDDKKVEGNQIVFNEIGNHTIKVTSPEYNDLIKQITLDITLKANGPSKLERGKETQISLTKATGWYLYNQESPDSEQIKIDSGNSTLVKFKPKKGIYILKTENGDMLWSGIVEKSSFWERFRWFIAVGSFIVFISLLYLFSRGSGSGKISYGASSLGIEGRALKKI